jgi:hypothetical protein
MLAALRSVFSSLTIVGGGAEDDHVRHPRPQTNLKPVAKPPHPGTAGSSRHTGSTVIDWEMGAAGKARADRVENNGIRSISDFLQRHGTGEPILGLGQDLISIGDRRKMKVFESASSALMCPEEALSQSDEFGAMNH